MAYIYSPDKLFILVNRRQTPHFFDMKPVMMDPESAVLTHLKINSLQKLDAVGGLELGAVSLTGIIILKAPKDSKIRGIYGR